MRGEVVGITNMKITFGEGLGFAIPISAVKYFFWIIGMRLPIPTTTRAIRTKLFGAAEPDQTNGDFSCQNK